MVNSCTRLPQCHQQAHLICKLFVCFLYSIFFPFKMATIAMMTNQMLLYKNEHVKVTSIHNYMKLYGNDL